MIYPHELAFSTTIAALLRSDAKRATKYISETEVVTATRVLKPYGRAQSASLVVTFGKPNYLGRQFIKLCKKAGVSFPVRKVQLKPWPKKRK